MDKFSIIIPTIWKGETINELLQKCYDSDLIGEVILINNSKENTKDFPKNDKLVYIEPEKNIFVNPSWNLGVRVAKNDNIVISNDDVLFDVNYFLKYLQQIDNLINGIGFVGMASDNYTLENNLETPFMNPYGVNKNTGGWACLFAFKKNNWKDIPETIKIYYGDNFIHMIGVPIYEFTGLSVKTKMSSSADTSVEWVKAVTDNDLFEWHKILREWKR
jgi:hypothetical protein